MSVHISSRAWKDTETTGTTRLLLLALADMANDSGVCWPSVATLAERVNVKGERSVQKHLAELEGMGYVRRDMRRGHSTMYHISIPDPRPTVHPVCRDTHPRPTGHPTPVPRDTPPPSHGTPHPRPTGHPEPSENRHMNRQGIIILPHTPQGGIERADEPDILDAFTPEELRSEPLPRGETRKQQEAKKRDADEKRTAIMAAFRSARFDRPLTDPVPVGEFNRMRKAADELLECGATPEQVREATEAAMLRFSTTAQVTLGAVSGNFTALLTPEVSRAPSSRPMSGADAMRERMEAVHKKHADILRGELEELGYEGIP